MENKAAVDGPDVYALSEEALPEDEMFAAYTEPTIERRLRTGDGVSLHALRLGVRPSRALILCHGFGGNKNIRNFVALAQGLSRLYTVYTFDFRGHGLSTGNSTFGYLEVLDIAAVVEMARGEGNSVVGALGFSMGGVSLMRYAALCGGLASVIVISVPSDIRRARAPGSRLIRLLMGNPLGRAVAALHYGVKVEGLWRLATPPVGLAGDIPPQPLTIIQGEDDYIFEVEQARELARSSGEGCRLRTFPSFGHAEQGYGPALVQYLLSILEEDLGAEHT